MEIKAELKQPYTEDERVDFIVKQNHELGYEIREVEATWQEEIQVPCLKTVTEIIQEPVLDDDGNPFLDDDGNPILKTQTIEKEVVKYRTETVEKTGYNLEAWGYTEEEKQEQKKEQIAKLSMTKREMFLGLYQAKGITPDMLKAQITDSQALIEFEYANDYYRGNPLIDVIGGQLGFTSEQLDKFFETKDYHYLTTCKLTINPTPAEATVVINSEVINEVTVPYGSVVDYVVSCDGYESKADVFEITKDEFLEVVLDEDTTDATESDIQDELDATPSKSDETDTNSLE